MLACGEADGGRPEMVERRCFPTPRLGYLDERKAAALQKEAALPAVAAVCDCRYYERPSSRCVITLPGGAAADIAQG